MKALHFFSLFLAIISMCACSGSESIPEPEKPTTPETNSFEIKMSLGGEYVEISESPLSKSETRKKYYGVNVYCMKTDGTENNYSYYAYGVFDNTNDMKITLLDGYKYKFECTSVEEMEDKLYINNDYIYNPVSIVLSELNKFIFSQGGLPYIKSGKTTISSNNSRYEDVKYPRTNRYYGELEYVPRANGTATIPMIRTSFGLNWTINQIPDGTLSWEIYTEVNKNSPSYNRYYLTSNHASHTGSETLKFSNIYTFYELYKSWSQNDYSVSFTIRFTWTRGNGYQQTFDKEIIVKRNVMTNINVTLTGGAEDITIGFEEENSPMEEETVDVTYDGGSMEDTQVDPDENSN